MKKVIKVSVLTLSIALFAPQLSSLSMLGKGKWMNVYNGQSTPHHKECVSALASKCLVGDTRGINQQ